MSQTSARPKIVGEFIRTRRSHLGLSQRSLGQRFTPPVTTQFISNVERGVTPLPPSHVPTLCDALQIKATELTGLMEQEFTAKLTGRLGIQKNGEILSTGQSHSVAVESTDFQFLNQLYAAYKNADEKTRQAFHTAATGLLNFSRH
jgi:transcriptional regulator with XRE-family HTH domain